MPEVLARHSKLPDARWTLFAQVLITLCKLIARESTRGVATLPLQRPQPGHSYQLQHGVPAEPSPHRLHPPDRPKPAATVSHPLHAWLDPVCHALCCVSHLRQGGMFCAVSATSHSKKSFVLCYSPLDGEGGFLLWQMALSGRVYAM